MSRAAADAGGSQHRERPLRVGFDPEKLRKLRPRDLAIRFAFGAGVSLVAALVGLRFGNRAGGLFLAFPAILPASLTLIESKEGKQKAIDDLKGAMIGGFGLAAFATLMLGVPALTSVPIALLLALVAWTATVLGLYVLIEAIRR